MKVTTVLLNLALTATAIAAALNGGNADLTKRDCASVSGMPPLYYFALPGRPAAAGEVVP